MARHTALRLAVGATLAGVGVYSLRRAAVHYRTHAASTARALCTKPAADATLSVSPSSYPAARRGDTVDLYHGTSVADPYRWLEEPDAAETKAFVDAQNALTASVLAQCDSRDAFRARMRAMYDFEKHGTPSREGQRYVWSHNSGLQAQSVLYSAASLDDAPVVLLNPNTLSADGTVSLSSTSFSHDGTLCAYGVSASGSDWVTGKALRVAADGTVTCLEDVIEHAKFTGFSWTHDNAGFFYARYKPAGVDDLGTEVESNTNHQVWFHRLGTPQAEDVFVYATPEEPNNILGASVSDDGRYLWITASEGCDPRNKLYYVDLDALAAAGTPIGADMPVVKLVDNFEAAWGCVVNDGALVTLQTNLDAPRYKLVRLDLDSAVAQQPPREWPELVPQTEAVLEWASAAKGDALLLCYLVDAKHRLQLHSLASGALRCAVPIPIGSVRGASMRREHSEVFISFASFLDPGAIYRLDSAAETLAPLIVRRSTVQGFDPDEYTTEQVFVASKDGTKVPMFIVTHRDFVRDGTSPALLYGYGGFSISITPSFSTSKMCAVRSYGACYAVANLRGGGEYGETWHKAGSLGSKQNVFDDFIACAEYLVAQGYTKPSKLAIEGGSNGGLLVAACVEQRPELFGAAIAHVGVMDMLRFHRFTIGHAWVTDYGCADADEAQFHTLLAYSPLHNVVTPVDPGVQYPSMLLLTGDHDDRVVPLHSLKLVATLQHALCGPASRQRNPLLIRVDTKSGHGGGKPTQKVIDEVADVYSFMAKALGVVWRD